jgi:hypothetical protein
MGFGSSYLDWNLIGIYDDINNISVPDINEKELYVMVKVSDFRLSFDTINSSKKLYNIFFNERTHTEYVSAGITQY